VKSKGILTIILFVIMASAYGQEANMVNPYDSLFSIYKDGVPILENVYSINKGGQEPHIPVNLQDGLVDTNAIWSGYYLDSIFNYYAQRIKTLESLSIKQNDLIKVSKQ